MTFLKTNHMKILIFNGTFIFQMYFFRKVESPSNKSRYIDLTVKTPEAGTGGMGGLWRRSMLWRNRARLEVASGEEMRQRERTVGREGRVCVCG
jgi:hypothetical protein